MESRVRAAKVLLGRGFSVPQIAKRLKMSEAQVSAAEFASERPLATTQIDASVPDDVLFDEVLAAFGRGETLVQHGIEERLNHEVLRRAAAIRTARPGKAREEMVPPVEITTASLQEMLYGISGKPGNR
jgi:hypothetical protein